MRQVAIAAVSGLFVAACGSITEPEDVLDCGAVEGLLACNTFEAEDPAWTTLVDGGVVVLDDSDASGGMKSLHATVAVGGGKAVRARSLGASDRYYAKFHLNLPTGADATGMSILHLGEAVAPFAGTNVEIAAGNLGVGVSTANVFDYPTPMPRDRWVCVELELVASDTGGRVIVRADGALVTDRTAIDTRPTARSATSRSACRRRGRGRQRHHRAGRRPGRGQPAAAQLHPLNDRRRAVTPPPPPCEDRSGCRSHATSCAAPVAS
jgi:hypothetical protein